MKTKIVPSNGIRIIELPECKMVSSQNYDLNEFENWWSTIEKNRTDKFFPRDFMYYDMDKKQLIWLYAHPTIKEYNDKYELIDFKGGLYAALVSKDGDDIDGERVYAQIKKWLNTTKFFEIDESPSRPHLFHVTTSDLAFKKMGYRQLDIYVPIK